MPAKIRCWNGLHQIVNSNPTHYLFPRSPLSYSHWQRRRQKSVVLAFMRSALEFQPRLKSDHTRRAIATQTNTK